MRAGAKSRSLVDSTGKQAFFLPVSRALHSVSVKMKLAVACLLVLVAMATVEAGPMKKRFLIKEIQNAINSVGDWFTKTYNSAKDSFNRLASGVNFDAAVNALIPYINSGMTVTACVTACQGAAVAVLGPAAALSGVLCTPLCDGALAKLEEIAG
ncbi:hypothetical protein RRG08_044555 [Elysia crispata]|uniref:Uncharacterized protein n=1 Tax=Elysia crispata TaxID=231223 RepID=A0AAE0ZCI7_9GAST|nr:hypothetical protein RRG08_044555 [Elysia crispata]